MTCLDDHQHTIGSLIEYVATEALDNVEQLRAAVQSNSLPLGYVDRTTTLALVELVAEAVAGLEFVVPTQLCAEVDFVEIAAEIRAAGRTIEIALPQ